MHHVLKSLASVLTASVMTLSVSLPAGATYSSPDYNDVYTGVVNAVVESVQLSAIPILNGNKLKIVYLEDFLNDDQITVIKNSLNNINVLNLQNILILKNVANGVQILSFGDVLSNNNAVLKDVIAVNVLNDGNVLVFCCH